MVHSIVTYHRGTITVESTLGQGTTFRVYLPGLTGTSDVQPAATRSLPAGSECILLVDEEPELAAVTRAMLERLSYVVVQRSNQVEALGAFRAMPQRFDVVLTIQQWLNVSSEAWVEELRRIRPEVAIVLCTGFSEPEPPALAAVRGIDAVCQKPIVIEELSHAIRRALRRRMIAVAPSRGRILVVDDEAETREMLTQTLGQAGYTVVPASTGPEGLQLHRQAPVDLVIINMLMPEQEGLDTMRILRHEDPVVRMIAISSGVQPYPLDLLKVAEHFGAQRMLSKPIQPQELLDTVRALLAQPDDV